MGYSILRSPRRRFGVRYSAFAMLASVRAEADAARDIAAIDPVVAMKAKNDARVRSAYRARGARP